jgi:hypothetical protein
VLATVTLDGSGSASFTTSSLAVGSHTITAVFEDGTLFTLTGSNPLTEDIVS